MAFSDHVVLSSRHPLSLVSPIHHLGNRCDKEQENLQFYINLLPGITYSSRCNTAKPACEQSLFAAQVVRFFFLKQHKTISRMVRPIYSRASEQDFFGSFGVGKQGSCNIVDIGG